MEFIGRDKELALLTNINQRRGAQLLILYGRRRIGKTRLLTHWLTQIDTPHLYWMATQTSTINQLRSFSQNVYQAVHANQTPPANFSYDSWEAAFAALVTHQQTQSARFIVILDEFTYVMQANPEIPSILQKIWDHQLKDQSGLFLILTGSLAGIIQRTTLDYQAPLYGRATARLKLQPLPFPALARFLPDYSPAQRVAVYAIAGGVPAYIELFDDQLNLLQNLEQRIITPANVMLGDAVFLLREQVEAPRNYFAIIEAIANGHYTLSDIARSAGIERSNLSKYLATLQELGYVERSVPATRRRPERSRRGRYVLTDPYLRFYFRFLARNSTLIERGMLEQVISLLWDHLADFIGTHTFEELCREWVFTQADRGQLAFLPDRVGSFWSKEAQIDVVAINWRSKQILLGECKWGRTDVDRKSMRKLLTQAPKAIPTGDWQIQYVFFARKGFTPAAQELAQQENVQLVTLQQLEVDMVQWLDSE